MPSRDPISSIVHILTALLICGSLSPAADDILIADFESETYDDWQVKGEAFGPGPAEGTLPGQMQVSGYEGERLVNSFFKGDKTIGTLTSPAFGIERDYLNFLIGGGAHPGETCINLMVGGEVARTATGPNDRPGGSEALDWMTWDVRDLKGKTVVLQIVDRHTGGWGHINVDHILQSDRRRTSRPEDRIREMALDQPYLLFPIDSDATPTRLQITVDEQVVQDFDINLAASEPDWWSHLDFSEHQGKAATLTIDRLSVDSQGLQQIQSAEQPRDLARLFDEKLRPQLRFSQQRGWNNDPNGMVYHAGEYHFFWQSNPFGPQWANMFWGHAVSRDLVHWEELPVALYPRTMAVDKCFSGTANVDTHNTGGWQTGDEPVLVAAFTDTGAGEAIAISRDRGRTFEYIPENPIIKHQGRDPKLIWYEPGKHWVIAVYTQVDGKRMVGFYTSKNLKEWKLASRIDGFFECPELFELPVDGDSENEKWVLFAADAQYLIGSFDGKTFAPDFDQKRRLHYGAYYASQCFSRAPDGRVIQIGWARINMPGMPFNQAFSLPTELSLKSTSDGVRLFAEPIGELESLRSDGHMVKDQTVTPDQRIVIETDGQLYDLLLIIRPEDAKSIVLEFGRNRVVYDVAEQKLDEMPLPLSDGRVRFRVVVDRPMYEICGGNGAIYKTAARADGGEPLGSIRLSTIGGPAQVESLELFPMRSIWKR